MSALIVTEKPDAGRNMARALGGMRGSYAGVDFEVVSLRGHLYEFARPEDNVPRSLSGRYASWDVSGLPWDPREITWRRVAQKNTSKLLSSLRAAVGRHDEIVIATDIDPTGEGDLIFWEVAEELGITGKRFTRMEFTDETPRSLQEAFRRRRPVASKESEGAYRKALYRSQWDYLSMQWTRVSRAALGLAGRGDTITPQGRLKSAMVRLVGDQCKAYDDYVRRPFWAVRFTDERGTVYRESKEARYERREQVPLSRYRPSAVRETGRERRRSAPPRLLDLAMLSARLAGRGIESAQVLDTYQRMYEAHIVSYPRTEDKTITPEQFGELAPLADRIARAVGVDPALLTHRGPRATHVKPQGAHGANRPGRAVPASLDEVEAAYGRTGRLIYEELARSYLAMLAGDHTYDRISGEVVDFPSFTGAVNVTVEAGWRQVFDDGESDEDAGPGLGSRAEPGIAEGANPRPTHPTMKWLVRQLEKRDVGTGATRTSTFSEVTGGRHRLLRTSRGRVRLTELGQLSWRLLPGTHIGDLSTTERVYADMRAIEAGQADGTELLGAVARMIDEDMETMSNNAKRMIKEIGMGNDATYVEGLWEGPDGPQQVRFKRTFSGHEFTDAEVEALLAGQAITFSATSARTGNSYEATGALGHSEFKGRQVFGFRLDTSGWGARPEAPTSWCGHTFTDEEVRVLLAGGSVHVDDFVSKRGNTFAADVTWDKRKRAIDPGFGDESTPPRSFGGHTFTKAEHDALRAGKEVFVENLVSRSGATYDAALAWRTDQGRKRIVPQFD